MWASKFNPKGKTALIVGASQGVGAEIAAQLYTKGCSVILVARTASKLEAQRDRINKLSTLSLTNTVSYISCDVSDYKQLESLWGQIHDKELDPDYIFCCAGLLVPKLFADLTLTDLALGLSTNYNTALNVVHTGFKLTLQQSPNGPYKPRHIVFFLLVVSFFPFIGYAQYAPLKAAVQSLSQVLRQELAPYNYRVSCVFPGNFQSEGYDEEQRTKPNITRVIEGSSAAIPAASCAEIVLDQLGKGYDTVTTDTIGWVLGCSVLGSLPRSWLALQILISFVFLIISPIATWVIDRSIRKEFGKGKQTPQKKKLK